MAFSKVKSESIADLGVTTAKIANDAVTATKVDDDGTGFTVGNLTNSGTLQQTGQVTLGSGGTNWTVPTARGTDGYVLSQTGGTGSWVEIALAPDITALNWYSDSGYSEALTDAEGINIDDATYLKITGLNLGTAVSFGGSAYIQIINVTTGNTVVGHNNNGLTGCITAASRTSDTEVKLTINPSGLGTISAGNSLQVKSVTAGGDKLFATQYVVSADPTSVTTVSSATVANGATVGTFGGVVEGGGQDTNTQLLLNFDRSGGTDIEDSSNTSAGGLGHKVTASGNAVIKASPFGDGKSAIFFDGTNDKLVAPDSDDWDFGTGNWTIECWVNHDSSQTTSDAVGIVGKRQVPGSGGKGWEFKYVPSSKTIIYFDSDLGAERFNYVYNLDNKWTHLAVVKSGTGATDFKLFIDGTLVSSGQHNADIDNDSNTQVLTVGVECNAGGNNFWKGYMDEIRIVKGTAVYSGDFTVPISRLTEITNTKLLIHSDKNGANNPSLWVSRATDSVARNGSAVTNWDSKAYYYHTTQRDSINAHRTLDIGSQKFTLEFWFRTDETDMSWTHVFKIGGTGGDAGSDTGSTILLGADDNGNLSWEFNNGGAPYVDFTPPSFSENTWYHIVLERQSVSSTTGHMWVNGTKLTSVTLPASFDIPSTNALHIGDCSLTHSQNDINFFIDDFHLVIGSNKYGNSSGTITPPTGSLTPTTNTTFLYGLHTEPIFTDSATSGTTHTITPTGAYHSQTHGGIAPVMAFPANNKKFGTSGIYFDGSGDYLEIDPFKSRVSTDIAFSMDFWFNQSSQSLQYIVDWRDGTPHNGYLYTNNNMTTMAFYGIGHSAETTITITRSLNTWYHFLYSRHTDGTWGVYIDGKMYGQGTGDGESAPDHKLTFCKRAAGTDYYFNGYLDNIRFTTTDVTKDTTDPLYTGATHAAASTSANNFNAGLPTKAYGTSNTITINPITLTGTPGLGGGKVLFNNATLSGSTETTSALPSTLTISPATDATNTTNIATISGDLTADAGTHSINIVARVSSDGAIGNIDPNRKQTYSHTITSDGPTTKTLFNGRRFIGNAASADNYVKRQLTGFTFKPNLVWFARRSGDSSHLVYDSLRGVTSVVHSDKSTNEEVEAANHGLLSFDDDGITLGDDTDVTGQVNRTDEQFVVWGWKANDSFTPTAANYTSPKGTRNVAGGFSIVQVTDSSSAAGSTITHGLSSTPNLIIGRSQYHDYNWDVWHSGITGGATATRRLILNSDAGETAAGSFQNWDVGSSTFATSGNGGHGNGPQIYYIWTGVQGVSSFGTFEGTGAGTTVTVTCNSAGGSGFRPRYKVIKRLDGTGSWWAQDVFTHIDGTNTQVSGNFNKNFMKLENSNGAFESAAHCVIEDTATGFKIHTQTALSGLPNGDTDTFIYWAFA